MLDQEKLYQLIFNEQWTDILSLLHAHKKDITSDTLLTQAATVFEKQFFDKLSNYSIERTDINYNLDILYILNHGNFYKLSADNYKKLIIELVKRKPLKEAVNYARFFPEDEICKATIESFETQENLENSFKSKPQNMSMNWIEIYNRLFEVINDRSDTATYFSGPRFIDTVREFHPYFPDYNQFIEQRNREGKSTSRKIFYYDILIEISEEIRIKVVDRILEILKPFKKENVEKMETLLGKSITSKQSVSTHEIVNEVTNNPVVFISYSWDNEEHKSWVLNLSKRLVLNGVDVILDRYYLKPGKNLPHFVEQSIARAERIIIVFTPNYRLKADKRDGGVGYEYSIMNADLYNNQTTNEKIIPVLRAGSKQESIPAFMQQFIHIDIRNNENFENSYIDLIKEIYNEPAIQKPQLGVKPIFENNTADVIQKPELGQKPILKS